MAQISNKELRNQQMPAIAGQVDKTVPQFRLQKLDRTLLFVVIGLCLIGTGIAGYLTYLHYTGDTIPCTFNGGCETVNTSRYATFGGLYVAIWGLAGYIGLLVLAVVRLLMLRRTPNPLEGDSRYLLDIGLFLAGLVGVAFSGYLTYAEAFLINAWCTWCLGSATTITVMLLINGYRLWLNYFSANAAL